METALVNPDVRERILAFEKALSQTPGAKFGDDVAPLEHQFADGCYIRTIFMPAGMIFTSKIHKIAHPYFVLSGDVSVLSEDGNTRIKAPFYGITLPGTKRVLFTHEDTVWSTVHVTKEKDLKKIEDEIIASSYEELPGYDANRLTGIRKELL